MEGGRKGGRKRANREKARERDYVLISPVGVVRYSAPVQIPFPWHKREFSNASHLQARIDSGTLNTLTASEANTGTWKTQRGPYGGSLWQGSVQWIRKNWPISSHTAIPIRPLSLSHSRPFMPLNLALKIESLSCAVIVDIVGIIYANFGCESEPANANGEWWRELQQPGGGDAGGALWLDVIEKIPPRVFTL